MAGKDRLESYVASKTTKGSPNSKARVRRILDQWQAALKSSEDSTEFIEYLRQYEDSPSGWFLGIIVLIFQCIGVVLGGSEPLSREIANAQYKRIPATNLDVNTVLTLWWRKIEADYDIFEDLRQSGYSAERIELLKKASEYYPGPQDLITWLAREVFEPEMIKRYGLDDELGGINRDPLYKAGMTDEQITNYWRAHWEHASWNQVVEMLHRGQLTEDEVYDWFRLVEIPPFWREKLTAVSWNVPTRVDVRRFYDLKTIDETRLKEIYTAMGYHGKDLDDYILWTKIYVGLPDLLARWKNGWITLDDVRLSLVEFGMSEEDAEELIQTKVAVEEPEDVKEAKALTKTEIYKGVKQEVITYEQGIELLMDLGYSRDKAEYLLTINVEVLTGSPETFEAFKNITDKYKRTQIMEKSAIPQEIKAAADELVKAKAEVDTLDRAVKAEQQFVTGEENLPEAATEKLKELQVTRNRARAELQRKQLDYDTLVARWKYGQD